VVLGPLRACSKSASARSAVKRYSNRYRPFDVIYTDLIGLRDCRLTRGVDVGWHNRSGVQMRRGAHSLAAMSLAVLAVLSTAGPARGATAVHPRQAFVGRVNGSFRAASLAVSCASGAETGLSSAGQVVAVIPPPPVAIGVKLSLGQTGTRAQKIEVRFSGDPSRTITLRRFGVNALIPTTLTLPCNGRGSVTFRPVPTSASARSSTIPVTYVRSAA
jgi:hypothetical protein